MADRDALAADIAAIGRQEKALALPAFDANVAWAIGSALRERAATESLAIAIEIRRIDQQLFFAAMPGATPNNVAWVARKAAVVMRFHKSSYAMGLGLKRDGHSLAGRYGLADADYAANGGAFPLVVTGAGLVGCATVSGLRQREDHELVVDVLAAHLGIDRATLTLPQA